MAQAAGTLLLGGDLPIHRLGFGAYRLTQPGGWGRRASPHALLQRAVELGVNLIDTADVYGATQNERLIAEALHPYPQGLVIATKGGLSHKGWLCDGSPRALRRACEGSLQRLKVERIDLYQLHAPDPEVPIEDSVGALSELRAEGKIRHIGLCNVHPGQLEAARAVAPIAAVQNIYNATERKWEALLAVCEERGLAFLAWHPLAGGSLARRDARVTRVANRIGVPPSALALAWVLKRSPALVPIPGTKSPAHLEENVGAAMLELSDGEFAELPVSP